ncbi:tyrosine--tRNA ligase [Candidatus Woesearchaeota archaeon]|nr:tyrosine--tRNA ligase [Candidatus Woesearchaeota archaeon]
MDVEKRFQLVVRNTEEVVTLEELKKLLQEKKKPSVYLGTAITGRPHIGYFVWVLKLADFLKAGFKVKLLLADIHGALDGTPWETLEKRYEYYHAIIPLMFECIGADIKEFEMVKGSSFQKKEDYFYDLLKMSTQVTINDCKRAAAEVVKFGDNPKLSGLIYPIMQSLDEEYLEVDIQYGGLDQRKILMFARENLPAVEYKSRIEVMTPIIPGLVGKKMSSSDPKTKIDLLDDEETVNKKIRGAECPEGIIEENGVLAFTKYVIMVLKGDKKEQFIIERPEKFGGNLKYSSYEDLEKDFAQKKLHPLDLKNALAKELNQLLKPIRTKQKQLEKISSTAYTN